MKLRTLACGLLLTTAVSGEWVIGGATDSAAVSAAPVADQQPDFQTLKAEFIPGEKTLFFDDFTDMAVGDAPPHFKVRGGAPELRASGAMRQLTAIANGSLIPNLSQLPKNFTFEAEIQFDVPQGYLGTALSLSAKTKEVLAWTVSVRALTADLILVQKVPYQELARKRVTLEAGKPTMLALWVQNGRVQAYLNGQKHIDVNQVALPPLDGIELRNNFVGNGQSSIGFRSVRFAESTPDFSQVITSTGRYVSHGILFDTGSDRLKPDSAPVIQMIAKALQTNPNLKLRIEGHTDSVGNAAQNLDLSKRRAEAVKSVLCAQFQVEEARLSTNGLGASKPIDSNDTPQGRSQNRRVEFIRQ